MQVLERRFGPMRLRAWGLVINFLANVTALYGLANVLRDGSGIFPLALGAAMSLVCILVLAVPVSNTIES